jgi:hypothetical protein
MSWSDLTVRGLAVRFYRDGLILGGLLSFLSRRLIFSVEGISEHAVYVNDLTRWSGFELSLDSARTALNDRWARSLGQLDAYCFLATLRACENGREFLLDNLDHSSATPTQLNLPALCTTVMNSELFQDCISQISGAFSSYVEVACVASRPGGRVMGDFL